MRRHTWKENLLSFGIGAAIGIPLSLASIHYQKSAEQEAYTPTLIECTMEAPEQNAELVKTATPTKLAAVTVSTGSAMTEAGDEGDRITPEEYEELATLVHAEAGNQDEVGKRLVVDVVLNRVESDTFPDTIHEVINQKYQFSTMWDGAFERAKGAVDESDYEAVQQEVDKRIDARILFFTAGGYGEYGTHAYQHGAHYFCYE